MKKKDFTALALLVANVLNLLDGGNGGNPPNSIVLVKSTIDDGASGADSFFSPSCDALGVELFDTKEDAANVFCGETKGT